MSLRTFLFPTYYDESRAYSVLLLVVRIFFGLLFLSHGYDKLMTHASMSYLFADPFGMGSTISFWMVVFAEVVCSFAVILGILQRLAVIPINAPLFVIEIAFPFALIFGILQRIALIPMIFSMCTAFFIVHGTDSFDMRELSFIYLIMFVILYVTGPGTYSFDALIGNYVVSNHGEELQK